jgi:hypothetical protein
VAAPDDGNGGVAGGVLGKLPRSRPGQRSERRGDFATRQRVGGSTPAPAGAGAASGVPDAAGPPDQRSLAGEGPKAGAALGGAVDLAGRAARLGLDAAGGVLKRLPRR